MVLDCGSPQAKHTLSLQGSKEDRQREGLLPYPSTLQGALGLGTPSGVSQPGASSGQSLGCPLGGGENWRGQFSVATVGMGTPVPRSIWVTRDSSHHRGADKIVCIKVETPMWPKNESKVKKTHAKGREGSCDR